MSLILSLIVSLLLGCLIFSVAYWVIMLISGALPPPAKQPITIILLVLLGIAALWFLFDLSGLMGTRHMFVNVR